MDGAFTRLHHFGLRRVPASVHKAQSVRYCHQFTLKLIKFTISSTAVLLIITNQGFVRQTQLNKVPQLVTYQENLCRKTSNKLFVLVLFTFIYLAIAALLIEF